jgi:hypothetical protein
MLTHIQFYIFFSFPLLYSHFISDKNLGKYNQQVLSRYPGSILFRALVSLTKS